MHSAPCTMQLSLGDNISFLKYFSLFGVTICNFTSNQYRNQK